MAAPWRLAAKGFFLQVSNPKAIFFWLAVASLGGLDTAPWPVIAAFVVGAFVNSTLGHAAWGLVFAMPVIRKGYVRARRWIEAALGTFFAIFAVRLATERG